jgi:hypothetical protein
LGADRLGLKLAGDFAGFRESAGRLLGEDELAVDRDLEDSSGSFDELGFGAELLLDLFRQTGGTRVVVSDGAVLDGDLRGHTASPFRTRLYGRGCGTLQARNKMTPDSVGCISAAGGPNGTKSRRKIPKH